MNKVVHFLFRLLGDQIGVDGVRSYVTDLHVIFLAPWEAGIQRLHQRTKRACQNNKLSLCVVSVERRNYI
jgi:hypothetical protein